MKKDFSYARVLLRWTFLVTMCTAAIQMSMAWAPQPTIQVLNSALPTGVNGVAYQAKLYASGGVGPYTWALLPGSVLPTGTLFQFSSGGVLSGTPTATGTYSIVVQATDANGKQAKGSYTLTISNSGITTTSLPSGIKGAAYKGTLSASGGAAPYSWMIAPGQPGKLPSGLSLNSSSGVISGTPSVLGYQEFIVRATDSKGQRFLQTLGINTVMPLTVSGSALPTGSLGRPYKTTLGASGGQAPYTWKVVAGTPPSIIGVDTTGTVAGTPTVTGSYGFTVQASDASGQQVNSSASIAITGLLAITTTSLPSGKAGVPYIANVAASGGLAPYGWNLTGGVLPPGLILSTLGGISGTPTAAGSFTFTLQVSDSGGGSSSQTYAVSMAAATVPVSITTTSLPNGTVGTVYSSSVSAAGGTSPYTWGVSAGALPMGLTLSSGGGISGTPTSAGSSTFVLKVTDSTGATSSQTYAVSVSAPPVVITTTSLPNGTMGTVYSSSVSATGGTSPYTWSVSAGALPAGLALSNGGGISGTPTAAGSSTFTLKVTDSLGGTGSQTYTISIVAGVVITTTSLPNGKTGAAYSTTLAATGGTAPYAWSVTSGLLPTGLGLGTNTGTISGTPSSAGTYTITVQAIDTAGQLASKALSFVIAATLSITTTSIPNAIAGVPYNATLAASGGTQPVNWAIATGQLPTGLSLSSSGGISGTPSSAGSFTFVAQATDSAAGTASQSYSATVSAPGTGGATITIKNADLPNGTVGTPYAATLSASGGAIPYTWSIMGGALPAGLILNSSTGAISGTPTTMGWSNLFTVQVADSAGNSGSLGYSLTINPVLDLYGGVIGQACTATGWFHTQKVNNRWWLCNPQGNLFWSLSVGGIIPSIGGTQYTNSILKKYGDGDLTWGPQQNRRMLSWGFNTIGQISTNYVWPITKNGSWPGGTQPVKMPFLPTMYTGDAFRNTTGWAPDAAKDLVPGMPPSYTRFRGRIMDYFDANAWAYLDGLAKNDPSTVTFLASPWSVAILGDDTDWMWGFGAGPDNPTSPDGLPDIHLGWLTAVTSPVQTFNARYQKLYSNSTVFSKAGKVSPPPVNCSVLTPCTFRDYLYAKYSGNIGSLNGSWGSNYTTFDSTSILTTETIGTGDGRTINFTHTMSHFPVSPLSVQVIQAGVPQAGDCPWWISACSNTTPNSGSIMGPPDSTVRVGVQPWLSDIYGKSAAGYPVSSYWAIILYHYPSASGAISAPSRQVGQSFSTGNQQPFVTSPPQDPQGLATGYDVYMVCQVWSGFAATAGCVGPTQQVPTPTLQVENVPIGTDWGVPASGLIPGFAVPANPSSINYQTGLVQVTFSTPPPIGQPITVSYASNGWLSGGTGVMDEDGTHPWVGTNAWCLTGGAHMCNGSILPVANANPTFAADADAWLAQFSANYHKQFRNVLNHYNPSVMFFGADTEGTWGGPPRKEILQGASPYVDALFPNLAPNQASLNYFTQYFGDKPILPFVLYSSTGDSDLYQYPPMNPGSYDFQTQEIRGQKYQQEISTLLNYQSPTTGSFPMIGANFWGLTDFTSENINWGLVSLSDNPYDGKSSCQGARVDQWGYSTGGEAVIPSWQAGIAYSTLPSSNGKIQVSIGGTLYTFMAIQGGVSSLPAPLWPTPLNATVVDGTVIWQNTGAKASATCFGDAIDYFKQANSLWLGLLH